MKSVLIAVLLMAALLGACEGRVGECTDEIIVGSSPESATLVPGETTQASYQLFSCQRYDGIPANPTWTSDNPDIATVNATADIATVNARGLITGVAVGKTDVVINDKEHSIVVRIPVTVVPKDSMP